MALRKEVTAEDAEAAITITRRSLEEVGVDMASHMMDIDVIMTGKPKSLRDKLKVILDSILDTSKETGMVEKKALIELLETKHSINVAEAERLLSQLFKEGTIYSPREGFLKKT